MRIAELHESPFTFKERLLLAFLAGLFTGAGVASLVVAIVLSFTQQTT